MPVRIDGFQDWRFDASVMRAHERIGKGVRSGVGIVLDFLLPPQCLAFGAAVDRPGTLCAECWNGTAFIKPPICGRCGMQFEVDEGEDVLRGACLDAPPNFDGARAALAMMVWGAIWCRASSSRTVPIPLPRLPVKWSAPVPA